MRTFKVIYTVTFETEVTVPDGENVNDVICDIEIPESEVSIPASEASRYVENSFEVNEVTEITEV